MYSFLKRARLFFLKAALPWEPSFLKKGKVKISKTGSQGKRTDN